MKKEKNSLKRLNDSFHEALNLNDQLRICQQTLSRLNFFTIDPLEKAIDNIKQRIQEAGQNAVQRLLNGWS